MFPVVRVDSQRSISIEPLGKKRKFWYWDNHRRFLFKAEERGTGEDWAEKVACELAALLGLPHVHYELAMEIGTETPGVACENCANPPQLLLLGNELLPLQNTAYPADAKNNYKVGAHTVDAVCNIVSVLNSPPAPWNRGVPAGINSALDVFVGYILLDTWIANQDRHHQNWGSILTPETLFLAPSFDHGGSMARQLTDDERYERLNTRDKNRTLAAFVRKARSAFFSQPHATKPMTTFAAWKAFSDRAVPARILWLNALRGIDATAIEAVLKEIPRNRMSEVCRHFTKALLLENQARLLTDEQE